MARILLAAMGSHGDLNPALALGRELKRRGHSVILAATSIYAPDAAREGLDFAPTRPEADRNDAKLMAKLMDAKTGSENVVRHLVMPAIRESYEDVAKAAEGADLLVSHVLTYAVPLVAEKKRVPWVSTILQPMMFFSRFDPPVVANAPWLGKLRPFGPGVNAAWINLAKFVSKGWSKPIHDLRAELGLPPAPDPLFHGHESPHGVLGLFSPLFGPPQPDWPSGVRLCGFPFFDEDFGGAGLSPELSAFLDEGEPPLVFTLGSFHVQGTGPFYQHAAEAARRLGKRAVLLAGERAAGLTALPAGVKAFRSAPYHALFPRAAVIVHSGGVGTTAQALRSGRPQLVVPHAHDQFDNAARVERLAAGATATLDGLSADVLEQRLRFVLRAPAFAQRAAELGRAIAAETGVKTACDALEAALTRR